MAAALRRGIAFDALATLAAVSGESLAEDADTDAGFGPAPTVPGRVERLGGLVGRARGSRTEVVITTDQASRIGELLDEAGHPAGGVAELGEPPPEGGIGLVHGSLSGGFAHAASSLLVLTDRELFGASPGATPHPGQARVTRDLIGKLSAGDLVWCTSTMAWRATWG